MKKVDVSNKIINIIKSIVWLIISFFILFYGIFEAVRWSCIKSNIEDNRVISYTGGYEIKQFQRRGRETYFFVLDNGDKVWLISHFIENKELLDKYENLKFTYIGPKGSVHMAYTVVEIVSPDNSCSFISISKENLIQEANGYIIVYILVSIPGILLVLIYFAFHIYIERFDYLRRKRNKFKKYISKN